jgi:hypothetical protein
MKLFEHKLKQGRHQTKIVSKPIVMNYFAAFAVPKRDGGKQGGNPGIVPNEDIIPQGPGSGYGTDG